MITCCTQIQVGAEIDKNVFRILKTITDINSGWEGEVLLFRMFFGIFNQSVSLMFFKSNIQS